MDDDKGRRAIQQSLSREIDIWLSGDRSRRSVLKGLLQIGGYAALAGPLLGATSASAQETKLDLAPPDTPLGRRSSQR